MAATQIVIVNRQVQSVVQSPIKSLMIINKALAGVPGTDGEDGTDGTPGAPGEKGEKGDPGIIASPNNMKVTVSATPPESPNVGDVWFDIS